MDRAEGCGSRRGSRSGRVCSLVCHATGSCQQGTWLSVCLSVYLSVSTLCHTAIHPLTPSHTLPYILMSCLTIRPRTSCNTPSHLLSPRPSHILVVRVVVLVLWFWCGCCCGCCHPGHAHQRSTHRQSLPNRCRFRRLVSGQFTSRNQGRLSCRRELCPKGVRCTFGALFLAYIRA